MDRRRYDPGRQGEYPRAKFRALDIVPCIDPSPVEGIRLRLFDLFQQSKPRINDR